MATFLGTRTTLNVTTTNKMRDVEKDMLWVRPYQYPITQFFLGKKFRQKETFGDRSKFEWYEDADVLRQTTTSVTGGGTTETLTVAHDIFRVGDVIWIDKTNENIIVTSVDTGSHQITVRKVGSGSLTSSSGTTNITNLSPSFTDDYTLPTGISTTETAKYGYCSILYDVISMTGRQQASAPYTGKDWTYQVMKKYEEIKKWQEMMWLFYGDALDDQTNDVTYTMGFKGRVTTNVSYYTGTLDDSELVDFLETVMDTGSPERFLYCSTGYMKYLDRLLKEVFMHQTTDFITEYGGITKKGQDPKFLTYDSPFGRVHCLWHPMIAGTTYSYGALCVDPEFISMRFMRNDEVGSRKWRIEKDIQVKGSGNKTDGILADTGLEIRNEINHGWHLKTA